MRILIACVIAALCAWTVPLKVHQVEVISTAVATASTETATDRLAPARLTVENVIIEVSFASGALELSRKQVFDWIETSARAVAHYYGRFPVSHVRLLLTPESGAGVHFGTTFGGQDPLIKIWLGQFTEEVMLQRDWVMTHEMVHLAFPRVPDTHEWIEEGLATYVEPLARFGIGEIPLAHVWQDLVQGLPKGLPQPGDQGLDLTHTWGRTYWGGTLFCLLADLEIRQRTANHKGLQDALRAIIEGGGTLAEQWPLTRAFKVGDRAVGVPVLMELYERMKATPVKVDLADLWQRLGVEARGDTLVFRDDAPLAAVRRAITTATLGKPEARIHRTQLSPWDRFFAAVYGL